MHFKILVANGVNLDLLGKRDSNQYGSQTLETLHKNLKASAEELQLQLNCKITLNCFQTNDESLFLNKISEDTYDGIVINPGAWTHYSLALKDRLEALDKPFVEVHLSNILSREDFRKESLVAKHSIGTLCGLGSDSYYLGLLGLIRHLRTKKL